jgi:hypothetical protein
MAHIHDALRLYQLIEDLLGKPIKSTDRSGIKQTVFRSRLIFGLGSVGNRGRFGWLPGGAGIPFLQYPVDDIMHKL